MEMTVALNLTFPATFTFLWWESDGGCEESERNYYCSLHDDDSSWGRAGAANIMCVESGDRPDLILLFFGCAV